ncbi:MAG TPA: efflux transporter outer membrane subunit [Steroidobacteraceae bacterium]|nr:efflux transporter outer membrane subunit [Steroidobacteraceae bacterium]
MNTTCAAEAASARRRFRAASALALCMFLTACITPPKVAPVEEPIDQRVDLGLGPVAAPAEDTWWTAYEDAQLDRLVASALADNPTMGEALARLRLAKAEVDATSAQLWPYVSYDAAMNRERISGKAPIPAQYAGSSVWLGNELLNFSWALDFWGRQRSLVRQAGGRADAAALDAAAARLAIVSAMVRTYIDLESSYRLADVAGREEEQRRQILEITRHRFRAGLDTSVELRQAEGAVPEARVERLADEAAIDRDVHLLAALAGRGAAEYSRIQRPKPLAKTALSLPTALPMDLLARRPDVLAARSRISAAQAGLAVARDDFYPNFNLLAFGGTVGVGKFANLFQGQAATWGVGPALDLPLFDAGRRKANYRAKAADVDLAVTAYNGTVLAAVRETSDQLSDIESLDASLTQLRQSLDDAETAYRLAIERYKAGLTTYLTVLVTETQVFDAQRQQVDLQSARASARVNLLIDVGGDFKPDSPSVALNTGR